MSGPLQQFVDSLPSEVPLSQLVLRRKVQYHGYRELLQQWSQLAGARSVEIGRSCEGEPLWMVQMGNPDAAKVSVVIAGIHPIEWIGMEVALQLAKEQAADPSCDRMICFFPMANPDGVRKVEGHLRAGRRKWVRSNAAGVDLNRNWPTHFKESSGLIAGHNRSGPAPCSEPEVAAIVRTLDTLAQHKTIEFALSLHSIGKKILLPWGGIWKAPAAKDRHWQIAAKIREQLKYSISQVSHWVPGISFAHGMEIDHLHHAYGAVAILIECTYGELSPIRPSVLLDPFRIFNPRDADAQSSRIARALSPFVRGQW